MLTAAATSAALGGRPGRTSRAGGGMRVGRRWWPAGADLEGGGGHADGQQLVAGVDREADGAAGVGDAPGDGLADPPGGVGRELEAPAGVEALDGLDETEVALLDEVKQRQPRRLV